MINLDFYLINLDKYLINLPKKLPGGDKHPQKWSKSDPALNFNIQSKHDIISDDVFAHLVVSIILPF